MSLKLLGLFSLEKSRLRGDLCGVYSFFTKGNRGADIDLFSLMQEAATGLRLHIRKRFFTEMELDQGPQGSDPGTEPAGVQGQCCDFWVVL